MATMEATTRWRVLRWVCTIGLALVLVGGLVVPARAHVRVFIGGVLGVPAYPYPYAYAYAAPPPCYRPYPYTGYVVPPARVRGHWAWRHDAWGRRIHVWVPPYVH